MTSKNIRWFFNVTKWEPNKSELLLATSCIQPEEKKRLAKFIFKKDFKSSLIGRIMMRKFVSEITGEPFNKIKFVRDSKGKPILDEIKNNDSVTSNLRFNVSHHGDYTVFAGHLGNTKLGVDVMKLEYTGGKNINEFFRIMARNFGSKEWETIKLAGNDHNQIAMFCRHWCLKESYVKAIGQGITINLQEIVFHVKTTELKKGILINDTELHIKGEKVDWQFHEMLIDDMHCVCVALSGTNNTEFKFSEIKFEELCESAMPLLEEDESYCEAYFLKLDKD